jgi:peptide/nickel transport system ATP-binding protein
MNQPANILTFPKRGAPPVEPLENATVLLTIADLGIANGGGRELVRGVSFSVPKGGTLGIVGESGSGKSLTCRAILGLLPDGLKVRSGAIRYEGQDLVGLPPPGWRALRGVHLAAVFQDPGSYLNPSIPVGAQLVEALRATLKLDRGAAKDRAITLLKRVGLAEAEAVYRKYPFELSGGMAQRVLIAIAVSANPQLLIADEATTALDAMVQAEVLTLLDDLRREQGLTLILVSHDLAVVSKVCDHVVVMRDGVIVEAGPARKVLSDPVHDYTRSLIDSHHRYSIDDRDLISRPVAATAEPRRAPALLTITGLHASYRRSSHPSSSVLHGINIALEEGEILGLIGETGSGKTTILRSILGLVVPQSGTISFRGKEISGLQGRALRALRLSSEIQYVHQDPLRSLDPDLPIGASIAEGLDIKGELSRHERAARVVATLEAVGLDPALAARRPRDLSGGQRQRAVIARALILDPAILLLDEPVSALDAVSRTHVLDLMRRLARDRGIAQIFISHDLGSIAGIADRVAVLYQGRIVESRPTRELIDRPAHPYTRRLLDSVLRLEDGRPAVGRLALPTS